MNIPTPKSAQPASTYVRCNLCGADDAETLFEAGKADLAFLEAHTTGSSIPIREFVPSIRI